MEAGREAQATEECSADWPDTMFDIILSNAPNRVFEGLSNFPLKLHKSGLHDLLCAQHYQQIPIGPPTEF